ncbi:MAG: hypothetical protein K2O18_03570, partial [Oscillospiraceae bacterium]|nr:hypothetical protein [Oscillospiraceae bacterium]
MAWNWFIQKKPVSPETTGFMHSVTDRFAEGNWLQFGFKWNNSDSMRPVMVRQNYFSKGLEREIYKYSNRNTHSYVCPHAFSYGNRTGEYLYALHHIVIDVDCHSARISKLMRNRKLDVLKNLLENDAFSDYDLPLPNYFVFTGRGIQIWWKHEPMSARACKNTWLSIVRCFIEIIKRIIAEHSGPDMDDMENLEGLEVDEAASMNTVGLFRIPGTFNPKAREYSYLEECLGPETVYSYQELRQFRDEYRAERPVVP